MQGPQYRVTWTGDTPKITWEGDVSTQRLTTTAKGVGYVSDNAGEPKLLLEWRDGAQTLVDRQYANSDYFDYALAEVLAGNLFAQPESNDTTATDATPRWTGSRTVRLSNPRHELVFVITPDTATATDNRRELQLSGNNGNYRVSQPDYEAGVSVRADGYVYHYYKPLLNTDQ